MSNNTNSLPLYEKTWIKHKFSRVVDSLILALLLLLLGYRVFSHDFYTFPCFVAFLCETWFTYTWLLTISTKWSPAYCTTYIDRLLQRVPESELPPVDLFVTTADPELEPPIITINTVLSLLALDYPANKLACYVSDDGCSPLTFYALVEASNFAKIWIPFCKKYNVLVRAPFRYFLDEDVANNNDLPEFKQEWLRMKEEYEHLCHKIQNATQKSIPLTGEFAIFSKSHPRNHPAIIKGQRDLFNELQLQQHQAVATKTKTLHDACDRLVICQNKKCLSDKVPHIIYIAREKRPNHPHHYKAGAMNVLTRVSGLMTNAPYILNVDCDMYMHNPKTVLHTMCIFLDSKGDKEVAFVQCPQKFYDGIKDDPFGNQLVAIFLYIGGGIGGLQGIFYVGTNCLHRRKVIYGLSPNIDDENGRLSQMERIFGTSKEFVESAAHALAGKKIFAPNDNHINSFETAIEVASCGYEYDTNWGKEVGWMYGSTSEDLLTGLKIHVRGWRSEFCTPNPIAFMGCSPQDYLVTLSQQKRWASGLLDIFLSKHCPIFGTLFGKLQFRECLAYIWITNWAFRSIPEICYAVLPAYCIITNSSFLPKELGLWILTTLLVTYNISTLTEYLLTGLSIQTWWNNQRMARITTMNVWFFGFLAILFKKLRISDTVFEITRKEKPSTVIENPGRLIFNESPIFLPGTTILLIQLTSLVINWFGWQQPPIKSKDGSGIGEVFCSAYVVVCYWPYFKGLFGKGHYGLPLSTICKATILAFLFVHFSRSSIRG